MRYHAPGTAPATLVAPEGATAHPVIRVIEYGADAFSESTTSSIAEAIGTPPAGCVRWIDIGGVGDVEGLKRLGEAYGFHPLALEDVLNLSQRPKVEPYSDHLFLVTHMIECEAGDDLSSEQVSIFLKGGVLVTIQEDSEWDLFDPVRERLRAGRGYSRTRGPDYLLYALLDAIVDHYYPVLEKIGDALEELEDAVFERPDSRVVGRLHFLKRLLIQIRRIAWPQRELLGALWRDDTGAITQEVKVFLRDGYDHAVQVMDIVESYRDMASGLMDMYMSSVSVKTNDVMRVLTVMSSIFIPLTFIAGIYGMNFEYMPELRERWGYFIALGAMVLVASGLLVFFRRKRWI